MSSESFPSSNEQSTANADAEAAFEAAQDNQDLRFDPATRQAFMDDRQTSREYAEASKNTQDWLEAVEDGYGPMLESAAYEASMPEPKVNEDMTLTELLVPYVEASKAGDKTFKSDIEDIISNKADKLRSEGKDEAADHLQEGFNARAEAAINRDAKKTAEAATGTATKAEEAGSGTAATAAEAGEGSTEKPDPSATGESEDKAEQGEDNETDKSIATDVVDGWIDKYKEDDHKIERDETIQAVGDYLKYSDRLVCRNGTPFHEMSIDQLNKDSDFVEYKDALEKIARSRGCEDTAVITEYMQNEVTKLLLASSEVEPIISTDKKEIEAYWTKYVSRKDSEGNEEIPYLNFVNHEGAAIIKKSPRIKPEDPREKGPVRIDDGGEVVPPVGDDPHPEEKPLPPAATPPRRTTEATPAVAQPERRSTRERLFGRRGRGVMMLGLVALSFAAGAKLMNYQVKNNDTPSIDSINKMQDPLRDAGVDFQTKENIANNAEDAKALFGHDQEEGKFPGSAEIDGKKMHDAFKAQLIETRKLNPGANEEVIKEMAANIVEGRLIQMHMEQGS